MFGLFKKKLKDVVDSFSNKAEEEAEKQTEESKKEEIKEEHKEEKKPRRFLGLFKIKEKKEEIKEEKAEEKSVEEKVEEIPVEEEYAEEIKEEPEEEKELEIKEEVVKEEKKEKTSFFEKLKGITKIKISEEKFEKLFEDLKIILLENNVAYEVIDKIKEDLKMDIVNIPISNVRKTIQESLRKSIEDVLSFKKINLIEKAKEKKPFVILFLGVNGAGKTTTIAKLCSLFLKNNLKCVLVAADTFRAASIQQLEEHAKKLGVNVIVLWY